MKIRNGFVSNSSSSSFLIYGAFLPNDHFKDEEKEVLRDKADEAGFYTSYGPGGCDGLYVGKSWDSVGDSETGKQFKDSVQVAIDKLVGKKTECGSHEASWYNG